MTKSLVEANIPFDNHDFKPSY